MEQRKIILSSMENALEKKINAKRLNFFCLTFKYGFFYYFVLFFCVCVLTCSNVIAEYTITTNIYPSSSTVFKTYVSCVWAIKFPPLTNPTKTLRG